MTTRRGTVPVSVVIPFYNGHRTLDRALRSLVAQDVRPDQIVIVDDGSPDPLPEDLPRRAANGLEVMVVSHERNRGIPAARNAGVGAARNDWVAFLDQDDEWLPEKLSRQWRLLERLDAPEATLVFGGCRFVDGDGAPADLVPSAPVHRRLTTPEGAVRELLLGGNAVPLIATLLHRDLLERVGGFDERITGGADDYALVLRLAADGVPLVPSDPPGRASTLHHLTGRNYSDPARWIRDEAVFLPELAARYVDVATLKARARAASRYRAARYHHQRGDLEMARQRYCDSLAQHAWSWKPRAGRIATRLPRSIQRWTGAIRTSEGSQPQPEASDGPASRQTPVVREPEDRPASLGRSVDVVILSLDRPNHTEEAIRSALAQAGVAVRVIVVDQGSGKATLGLLRRLAASENRVTLIELGRNVGVPGGRNIGMRAGSAPVVASIDNDAMFADEAALRRAVGHLERDPTLGALSFRIVEADTGAIDRSSWFHPRSPEEGAEEAFFTGAFVGAGHALRREAVEAVGGYDDELFFMWEERDLSLRLVARGYRVLYCPDVTVRHAVARERRVHWGSDRYYFLVRNSLWLQCRYWGAGRGLLVRVLGYALRGAINGVLLQALRGLRDGLGGCLRGRGRRGGHGGMTPVGRRYLALHEAPYRGSTARRALDQLMWRKED